MATRLFNVPNQLTLLRLGFLPLFLILIIYDRYGWGLAVLLIAAITDGLDGLLARRLNQSTALGAYLDPIADKMLLSSSFLVLALKGKIHWWVTVVVMARDAILLTTAVVIILVAGYRRFPPASWQGHHLRTNPIGFRGGYRGGFSCGWARSGAERAALLRGIFYRIFRIAL